MSFSTTQQKINPINLVTKSISTLFNTYIVLLLLQVVITFLIKINSTVNQESQVFIVQNYRIMEINNTVKQKFLIGVATGMHSFP